MNTLKAPQVSTQDEYLERSRDTILNLGYAFVIFKSKAKKTLIRFKRRIVR